MKCRKRILVFCFCFLLLFSSGCDAPPKVKILSLNEAHKHFIKLCKDEYSLDVVVKPLANTVWVYVPLTSRIFEISLSTEPGDQPIDETKPVVKNNLNFVKASFKDGVFMVDYDVSPSRKYAKDLGYKTKYAEAFRKGQTYILYAVSQTYSEMEFDTGKSAKAPDFFSVVFADVENGFEYRMHFAYRDVERLMRDAGFQEEYSRRVISDDLKGNDKVIGDKNGDYIELFDWDWPSFIARQIEYRLLLKYNASSFPPSEDNVKEVLNVVYETVVAYDFEGFDEVALKDLVSGEEFAVDRRELSDHHIEGVPPKGKLHVIKFR